MISSSGFIFSMLRSSFGAHSPNGSLGNDRVDIGHKADRLTQGRDNAVSNYLDDGGQREFATGCLPTALSIP